MGAASERLLAAAQRLGVPPELARGLAGALQPVGALGSALWQQAAHALRHLDQQLDHEHALRRHGSDLRSHLLRLGTQVRSAARRLDADVQAADPWQLVAASVAATLLLLLVLRLLAGVLGGLTRCCSRQGRASSEGGLLLPLLFSALRSLPWLRGYLAHKQAQVRAPNHGS